MVQMDPLLLNEEQRVAIEQEMANHANMLLSNPAFAGAIKEIKDALLGAWVGTKTTDTAAREEYQRRYVAVITIEGIIRSYLETGIMNNIKVEEERKERSRSKKYIDGLKRFWKVDEGAPDPIA